MFIAQPSCVLDFNLTEICQAKALVVYQVESVPIIPVPFPFW